MVIRDVNENCGRADGDDLAKLIGRDTLCFRCSEPISEHLVQWIGHGADISIHPECAIELAAHLLSDAFKALTGFEVPYACSNENLLRAMGPNCVRLLQERKRK
jgi:hypothetical protein